MQHSKPANGHLEPHLPWGLVGIPDPTKAPAFPIPQQFLGLLQGLCWEAGFPHLPKLSCRYPLTRLLGFPPEAGEAGGSGTSFSVILPGENKDTVLAGAGPTAGPWREQEQPDLAGRGASPKAASPPASLPAAPAPGRGHLCWGRVPGPSTSRGPAAETGEQQALLPAQRTQHCCSQAQRHGAKCCKPDPGATCMHHPCPDISISQLNCKRCHS